jgi:hypothetical protein
MAADVVRERCSEYVLGVRGIVGMRPAAMANPIWPPARSGLGARDRRAGHLEAPPFPIDSDLEPTEELGSSTAT